ncbi:heavy-metal-associated domain-containing protein [Qipengyuania sp. XHP0207]|uniref:heavy-metal-associated domain-containing protein n=1 Tax=Qipengyuania sp. XHP0207 TaxID=3038078 RepID=UPI00241E27C9|nr:heavy-metal-associated domain-containing protein [Qipengyuania sp. XHP0207]MDG5747026.1 heavy-metal-associated domain-containing protein [Qipengyuania sp. XHP0207]
MDHALPLRTAPRRIWLWLLAGLAVLAALGVVAWAQVGGERGIAAIAASRDIEVSGIEVDVRADSGEEAREEAWTEAARLAWEKIDGPDLPDSQIEGLVSAIVIERERLGPRRYIATLGVIFDRSRAARYLGEGGAASRSAPMLLVPVTMSAGTNLVYERRNEWQRAWAGFQAGSSRIDYVRPVGSGGDSLIVTYGQTGRRSRVWWRNVLDQFGAADVLVPVARLRYSYPGGPVEGTFTARYGPDNTYLDSFTMSAESPEELPAMLDRAVQQFDRIFTQALADGKLRPDPTLNLGSPESDPAIQRLIELGRALMAQDRANRQQAERPAETAEPTAESGDAITAAPIRNPPPEGSVALYTVQVATPDAPAFDDAMAGIRGASGVRSTGVRSTAIGGTSVVTVSYAGSIGELAAALRARGFTVTQGSNALSISR